MGDADAGAAVEPALLPTVPELPFYQYKALQSETHIRRLILDPGNDKDPLSGTIEVIELAKAHLYPYQAISYVWGSAEMNNWILVDGQQLPITENLAMALRQARQSSSHCALWADSVCINQSDDREKGHQVRRMGQIYKQALRTLICLGCDNQQDARVASDLIRDVVAMIDRVFTKRAGFLRDKNSFPRLDANSPLLTPSRWLAIAILSRHPWFTRGWTVQEVAHSPSTRILWAGLALSWIDLLRTYLWYIYRARSAMSSPPVLLINGLYHHAVIANRQVQAQIRSMQQKGDHVLAPACTTLATLDWARELRLAIAKDRIYAFMGMPTSDEIMETLQLKPDYSSDTSHFDVYHDFAMEYLRNTRDLNILLYAVVESTQQPSPPAACSLPSWIPRWDVGISARFAITSTTKKMEIAALNPGDPEFSIQDNGLALRVEAILFDAVAYTAEVPPHDMDWANIKDVVKYVIARWRDILPKSVENPGPHHGRLAEAFIATLCCGRFEGKYSEWVASEQAFARLLKADTADRLVQDYVPDPHVRRIIHMVAILGGVSRLAIFDRGQYGLMPLAARKGDICALISGTSAPLIIRKVAGDGHCYTIIGPAYIQGKTRLDLTIKLPLTLGVAGMTGEWKDLHMPTQEILLY